MDQRNAARSRAAIAADHGWHTYAADHLALMDHLGHRRFHTLGGCIGASFCLKLCELAPERVSAAVLQNPIGLNAEAPSYFPDSHQAWAQEQRAARHDLDAAALASFGRNMWDRDFVFSVSRDFVRGLAVPCLVLGRAMLRRTRPRSAPNRPPHRQQELLDPWKGPEHLDVQGARVLQFLSAHTPKMMA